MSLSINILRGAEQDLNDLKKYLLREFSVGAWQNSYQLIKQGLAQISSFPESGSIPPELEHLGFSNYKQIIVGKNRIIYELNNAAIYVHIICDVRRDMPTLLNKRLFLS
ncbi:plasmid stabilization protein [Gammaproteobacteria bacterium]|nr:plasmid stabilization protein [Gammaproteobacteria bacterium]